MNASRWQPAVVLGLNLKVEATAAMHIILLPAALVPPLQRADKPRIRACGRAGGVGLITLTKLHNPALHRLLIRTLPSTAPPHSASFSSSHTRICVHLRPQLPRN